MNKEIRENYIFKGFGFPVVLPFAIFKENNRGTKYLDMNMEEIKNKVAYGIITYPYAYTGAMLNFIRNYLDFSTIQMAKLLSVVQQTITNWEKKKKNESLNFSDEQRSHLILKLRQYFFNKQEVEIHELILNSKKFKNDLSVEPIVISEFYKLG